jgi:DNA-binding MarR family transcriptional regulator
MARTATGESPRRQGGSTAELAELFTHTARRLRRGSSAQLAPLGLTYGQARALRLVADAGRPLRMADLAAQLEVVPRSATAMADALETAGLVVRSNDPGDRRSVLVSLTATGTRLVDRLDRARRRSAEEVFGGLAPSERAELRKLLGGLCARGACVSCCDRQPSEHLPGHVHRSPHANTDPRRRQGGAQ